MATETTDARRALIAECVDERVWAVVGASTDPNKWVYRIYTTLRASGYRVYPVNPRAKEIAGERCYL
jgi:predicted CoA-binding protein